MPTTVQFRRGTTAQNNAFTGAVGEVTVDTDKNTLVVHDGTTAGGVALTSSASADPSFTSSTTLKPELTLKNTTDDATGPIVTLESDRATPADNDIAGTIQFKASDDAGQQTIFASIQASAADVTNSSEDGKLTFNTFAAGSDTTIATIDASGVTVNSGSLIATTGDFQTVKTNVIESDDSTKVNIQDALEVDGALDVGAGFTISNTTSVTSIVDEDNMASNSATALATQQSIKAYVDGEISTLSSGTVALATSVTVTANNTANETVYITFVDGATGTQGIETDTNLTYNPSTNVLSTTASAAQYSDLAENYSADQEYQPGTVVVFGGEAEITQSTHSHDSKVAGVVSTAPAYLMNATLENGTALALHGRVPCKVVGTISKGDLMVSSTIPGVACAMDSSLYSPGCVIGKALESYDSQTVGTIEVVVGRL